MSQKQNASKKAGGGGGDKGGNAKGGNISAPMSRKKAGAKFIEFEEEYNLDKSKYTGFSPGTDVRLDNVLTYEEFIPAHKERPFSYNLYTAFAPCRYFMLLVFRFPLVRRINIVDLSPEFTYAWTSFRGWMFFITLSLLSLMGLLISSSILSVLLNFPSPPKYYEVQLASGPVRNLTDAQLRVQELFLLQRNFVPIIIIVLGLSHICIGDISIFSRRNFISKYFTFWHDSVEILKMDAGKTPDDVRKFMMQLAIAHGTFLVLFMMAAIASFAPVATGAPAQLVILWCRAGWPTVHTWKYFRYLVWPGYVCFGYIIVTIHSYGFLFIYKCRILKNAFTIWNERLDKVLHKRIKVTRLEQCRARTGFDHLFKDFVMLLDLLRGADTMFANTIESYFGTQVFALCFEVYYFIKSLTEPQQFQYARKYDAYLIGIHLCHSMMMLFVTLRSSAVVGDVAMEGLEIIRRNGILGHKSNEEMYFTLSMYMSFTGHFETALTAGRFVTFDRAFIVATLATIFAYFIILSQFSPKLAMLDEVKLNLINSRELLLHVENTRHYNFLPDHVVGF